MEKMTVEQYVSDRLDDQIAWYDRKSGWNQRWFKRLQLAQIIASALVPFISGLDEKTTFLGIGDIRWMLVVGLLGMLVAIATAAISLFKFQENWVQYRMTAEQLHHERFLFLTGVEPYHDTNAFKLLVQRIENLISRENSLWAQPAQERNHKSSDNQPNEATRIDGS
jgi:hypothetical protein